MLVPTVSIGQLFTRIGATLLVLAFCGWVAAALAKRFGDDGPSQDGRRSIDPIGHLDLMGVVVAVFYGALWPKPIDSDVERFRRPRAQAAWLVLGATAPYVLLGFASLAVRGAVVSSLDGSVAVAVGTFLSTVTDMAFASAALGLLPIPPLLGSHWWAVVRPSWSTALRARPVRTVGTLVVVVGFVVGFVGPWLGTATRWLRALL